MQAVHVSILSMPLPSVEQILKIDPLAYDRPLSVSEAAEFIGISAQAMQSLRRRNQGPRFQQPKGFKRVFTTPRDCIAWLQSNTKLAKKRRSRLEALQ